MFLPDYLKKGFDSTTVDARPLVSATATVLPWPKLDSSFSLASPFFIFASLLVLIGGLTLAKLSWSGRALRIFDGVMFFLVGIIGLLMLTLWIIRVDTVCRNNLNILWALPTHVAVPFLLHRNNKFRQKYFQVVFWINIALAFTWFLIPQQLNNAVGPLLLLLIIRSYQYSKTTHEGNGVTIRAV